MRKKVKMVNSKSVEYALANNNVVYYKDELHRIQKDMFGNLVIESLVKEEGNRLVLESDFKYCFLLLKR